MVRGEGAKVGRQDAKYRPEYPVLSSDIGTTDQSKYCKVTATQNYCKVTANDDVWDLK